MILGELTNALVHLESHRSEAVAFLGDMSDAGKCEVICEQAGSVEEVARIVAHIRRKWPRARILLRADSGFARDELMAWCEANGAHFVFGLAQNDRLNAEITSELAAVQEKSERTGKPARRFKEFKWRTRKSWSRKRRVVAKAE